MAIKTASIGYCLEILLPENLEAQFRRWVMVTPGATWPAWGGHVTLLSRFVPVGGMETIRRQVGAVCARFAPFPLRLSRVITEDHWRRPQQQAVLLVSAKALAVGNPIVRLQSALAESLAPWKRDLRPEVSGHPFAPHLSLTIGLPKPEAEQLALVASKAHLAVEFSVESVWLLQISSLADEDGAETVSAREPYRLTGGQHL